MTNHHEDALRVLESRVRSAGMARPRHRPRRYRALLIEAADELAAILRPSPPDSSQGEPTCYVAEESLKRREKC